MVYSTVLAAFLKIRDTLLSDIFHHRRNDYGIFSGKNHSAGYARDRMKLLLVSERIDCSPQMMKLLRNDLIHAVKKYVVIDEPGVTIQITQEPPVLHAVIPVLKKRDA